MSDYTKGQFHVRPRRISSLHLPLSLVYQTYLILVLFALQQNAHNVISGQFYK